jgi:hypothetical protein
MARILLAT